MAKLTDKEIQIRALREARFSSRGGRTANVPGEKLSPVVSAPAGVGTREANRGGVSQKRLKAPAAKGGIVPPVPPNLSNESGVGVESRHAGQPVNRSSRLVVQAYKSGSPENRGGYKGSLAGVASSTLELNNKLQSVADDNGMAPKPEKFDRIKYQREYMRHWRDVEARKPWLELGMSRRTWYNRQSEKRKES